MGVPFVFALCEQIEKLCKKFYSNSEQHLDARDSRKKRDLRDLKKITEYFDTHDPFRFEAKIISIATGVIGGKDVNPCDAFTVGSNGIKQ